MSRHSHLVMVLTLLGTRVLRDRTKQPVDLLLGTLRTYQITVSHCAEVDPVLRRSCKRVLINIIFISYFECEDI